MKNPTSINIREDLEMKHTGLLHEIRDGLDQLARIGQDVEIDTDYGKAMSMDILIARELLEKLDAFMSVHGIAKQALGDGE